LPAVVIGTSLVIAAGWILIARGLRTAGPAPSDLWLAGLANLVAVVIAIESVTGIGVFWALEAPGSGESELPLLQMNAAALVLVALATAYLGRIVIRAARDRGRPPVARALATASVLLLAGHSLLVWFGGFFMFGGVLVPVGGRMDPSLATALLWLTDQAAWTLFLVALGLGLADTAGRAPLPVPTDPRPARPDGPSWPEPAAEVPAYQDPASAMSTLAERARARRAG
jgi:hypothetical protein